MTAGGEDRALIIGSGFGGLCAAIELSRRGIDSLILEQDVGLGGTWRANHYPGCACDVESHFYSYSFEPYAGFSRSFAPQAEILAYMQHCAEKYGVASKILFGREAMSARFDERAHEWQVSTSNGETHRGRWLIAACGGLSRPSVPALPGLESFENESFHSARWRDGYDFRGKDVAVIGTGASAIQIVPALAPLARRLTVYQRTAPWIVPRHDREIGARERNLLGRFPALLRAKRAGIFVRRELYWLAFVHGTPASKLGHFLASSHLKKSVRDPELRKKLSPNYAIGCKRILISDDYYPALQRDNVELVTEGIDRIVKDGVLTADGRTRHADALVLATGFHAAEAAAPVEMKGRGERDLAEAWQDGAEAYLGTVVSGFPNFFMVVGPNTGLGHGSMIFMIESQVAYIAGAIGAMKARGSTLADVKPEVQRRYNEEIHGRLANMVWAKGGCASWYKTRSGKNTTLWPGLMADFQRRTARFDPNDYLLSS